MPGDPLDPAVLTARIPSLLPEAAKKLGSPQDGLAALLHTAMAELGFRLIAVDENSPPRSDLNNVLPEDWAKNGPGSYTFRYKHDQSSLEFLLKVSKLGNRTLFNAIALEVRRILHLNYGSFFNQNYAGRQNRFPRYLYQRFYLPFILPSRDRCCTSSPRIHFF